MVINPHPLKNRLQDIIQEINQVRFPNSLCGLFNGNAGLILFLHYSGQRNIDENYFASLVDTQISIIRTPFPEYDTSLADGFAGMGCVLQFLNTDNSLDNELQVIDNILYDSVCHDIELGNYDLLYGYIGSGVYFLQRNPENNILAQRALTLILDALDSEKVVIGNAICWTSFDLLKKTKQQQNVDLGIAHGMCSILIFLQKLLKLNNFRANEKLRNLIVLGCDFLLSAKINPVGIYSYSYHYSLVDSFDVPSRLAWCYGDLCVALTFLHCGKIIDNAKLVYEATKLFLNASKIMDASEAKITDNYLCHGAAGIAAIFEVGYHHLKHEELRQASIRWKLVCCYEALNKQKVVSQDDVDYDDYDMLSGKIGEGLVLLMEDSLPHWLEYLLIN